MSSAHAISLNAQNGNYILFAALLSWFIAQIIKAVHILITTGKINLKRFLASGGMPSSHTALVIAMSTAVLRVCGFSSPEFAIAALLSCIVMYDATGVRRATGEHAKFLNELIDMLSSRGQPLLIGRRLKEILGHTPLEVGAGFVLGLVIALVWPLPAI